MIYLADNDYKFLIYTPDTTASGFTPLVKGEVATINDIVSFAFKDFDEDRDVTITMITETKQARGTKAQGTGEGIEAGKKVYYNTTTEMVTTTVGSNTFVGYCIRDADDADEYVDIAFDGNLKNLI